MVKFRYICVNYVDLIIDSGKRKAYVEVECSNMFVNWYCQ
jgi:hypothetical protein